MQWQDKRIVTKVSTAVGRIGLFGKYSVKAVNQLVVAVRRYCYYQFVLLHLAPEDLINMTSSMEFQI